MIEFPLESPLTVAKEANGEPPLQRDSTTQAESDFESVLTSGARAAAVDPAAEQAPVKGDLIEHVPPELVDDLPASLLEELALGLAAENAALNDLEIDAIARHVLDVVDDAAVSQLVLMSKFATGRLAYTARAVDMPQAAAISQPALHAARLPTTAPAAQQARDASPRMTVWQSPTVTVGALRGFSAGFDRQMARLSETVPRYERMVTAAVPAREHLLVITDNGDKRIYIRNFFSPEQAVERFRTLARNSPLDLSGASVFVNGSKAGRV